MDDKVYLVAVFYKDFKRKIKTNYTDGIYSSEEKAWNRIEKLFYKELNRLTNNEVTSDLVVYFKNKAVFINYFDCFDSSLHTTAYYIEQRIVN